MFHNLSDIGRGLNLFLSVVALIWLLNRRIYNRNLYHGGVRNDIWLIAVSWCGAVGVGTFEQLFNTGTTIRVMLSTVALVVTIRLLWRNNRDWLSVGQGGKHEANDEHS